MGEQKGRWQKLDSGGRFRSVWDEDGNFLRSEAQYPGMGMPERKPPRVVRRSDAPAAVEAPERRGAKVPRPVRLAGGCKLYQLPGADRPRRSPAKP